MENKDNEEKQTKQVNRRFAGTIEALLEAIRSDKDESVKAEAESALIRIADKRPEELLLTFCDYRSANEKIDNNVNACILRVTQFLIDAHVDDLGEEALDRAIKFVTVDLTRFDTLNHAIQWPAQEIIVSIGRRKHCGKIIENFHFKDAVLGPPHYMILNCIGTLASANPKGVIEGKSADGMPFVKNCLDSLLPTLSLVKLDYVRQAHAFVVGKFCEAVIEHKAGDAEKQIDISSEVGVIYDVFVNNWLPGRDSKVSADVLSALCHMFPLLQRERIQDQSVKIVGVILNLYRKSIDRFFITQFLSSIIETCFHHDRTLLDPISNNLIVSLFDLVIVNPDFEKPQTVKSHYEVLRCFDLLSDVYGTEIVGVLLIQLRSNNERERIKSLLVVTHLTSTAQAIIQKKQGEFLEIVKQMIANERSIKMKMALLKIVVAFAEKNMTKDIESIQFIIKNCCILTKTPIEFGSADEYSDFLKACNSSLHILCSTVNTMDDLLKAEILQTYLKVEFTVGCTTFAKCLASLFAKNAGIKTESTEAEGDYEVVPGTILPSVESVFIRSLALLGNYENNQRILNVLAFLKSYCTNINKHLAPLWNEKIPELTVSLGTKDEALFYAYLYKFFIFTLKDIDDPNLAETLANKITDQLCMYLPINQQLFDIRILRMAKECGLLLKLLGISLCHITDVQTVEAKLNVIIETVKALKIEKLDDPIETIVLKDAAKAIGEASKVHFSIVKARLELIVVEDSLKKSNSIFSTLNFMKDNTKEEETAKMRLLIIESWSSVIENAPPEQILKTDNKLFYYLCRHLSDGKDLILKKIILKTFLNIVQHYLKSQDADFTEKHELLKIILDIPLEGNFEYLPLFPLIIQLTTSLIKIPSEEAAPEKDEVSDMLQMICHHFFVAAQNLKTKFSSPAEDEKVSYIAKHVNLALPELNTFIKVSIELTPAPNRLEDINNTLDLYLKDKNSEVRICACHITNAALDVYMKIVKPGVETSVKFTHTGSMLGRIVPRCIDSNATVRQVAVDILRKILEISCLYDTLTAADNEDSWIKELQRIKDDITTDDPKEIYRIAGDLAAIISTRLINLQFVQFCKTLMYCINDPEPSSGIGASIVLKFFTQLKGAEIFHAIPDLVREAFCVIRYTENTRAKTGVIKSIVALTKHHPKLVCNEILAQPLPFEENALEYWRLISYDPDLCSTVIDNFLSILSTTCLYEEINEVHRAVTVQPFAIICALHEIFKSDQIRVEVKSKFADLLAMLLTTVATYTGLDPPLKAAKTDVTKSGKKSPKYGYIPNRDLVKIIPCQVVLDAFKILLDGLEMEQVSNVLTICPTLASCTDLKNFIEILTPLAIGLVNQLDINSNEMRQIVMSLAKYVPSPYDGQRIAALGLYSQLVTLKPAGEIVNVIILHLASSLNDPNAIVRGLAIQGLGCIGDLTSHDAEKYAETSLTALLKGIDDYNADCLINIPLESMRGLSKILQTLPPQKLENFQVTLAVRIKPYFENTSNDLREAAILLFGDLCYQTRYLSAATVSEALKEQLLSNLFVFLLHLAEQDSIITRACKLTMRNVCSLLGSTKMNEMVQENVSEYSQLNYEIFLTDFVKLVGEELPESVPTFIECLLPFLKSLWSEIRESSAYIIAILSHYSKQRTQQLDQITQKIALLLKDDNPKVRVKASMALGYIYGSNG